MAILLTYGTARILLAGDAEANEEVYRPEISARGLNTPVRAGRCRRLWTLRSPESNEPERLAY